MSGQLEELKNRIQRQGQTQNLVGDSSQSLRQTLSQLLDLQRLRLEKSLAMTESEQAELSESLSLFLENQKRYQEANQELAALIEQRSGLEDSLQQMEEELSEQREPARREYQQASKRHDIRLAFFQLALLLPVLAAASVLYFKKRQSLYAPLAFALGAATLVKVGFVMHQYFPARLFKYILILALLGVVGRLLIYLLRAVAHPQSSWLNRQYREAYERFLCPVCEFPIRMGPRKFLYWTRRTVNKNILPTDRGDKEEAYACPSCGTTLFDECPSCHKIRHALLPHCRHCGGQKSNPDSRPRPRRRRGRPFQKSPDSSR